MFKWMQFLRSLWNWDEKARRYWSGSDVIERNDLKKIYQYLEKLSCSRDPEEIYHQALSQIYMEFHLPSAILTLKNETYFRIEAHRMFPAELIKHLKIPLGTGPIGECFSSGHAVKISLVRVQKLPECYHRFLETNWEAMAVYALSSNGKTYGVLCLCGKENILNRLTEEFAAFSKVIAVSLRSIELLKQEEKFNKRLEAEVTATTAELSRTNLRLIHRVRELKALYEITLSAHSGRTLEEMISLVQKKISELFQIPWVGFFINQSGPHDPARLAAQSGSFDLPDEILEHFVLDSADSARYGTVLKSVLSCFQKGETRILKDSMQSLREELPVENRCEEVAFHLKRMLIRSSVAIPLATSEEKFGVMVLFNCIADDAQDSTLQEEDFQTLNLIAMRLAASIANITISRELDRRLHDLSTLKEINETIYATPVLEAVLAKMAKILRETIPATSCSFMFFDPISGEVVLREVEESFPVRLSQKKFDFQEVASINENWLDNGKTKVIENASKEETLLTETEKEKNVQSLMLVPLKVETETIGILRLGSNKKNIFHAQQADLVELIGDRVAVIVQNARLYEKILRSNQELERLNKVKSEFVSMVSHELRTPLTAIKGFVDIVMLGDAGPVSEQQQHFLKIAHHSIDRLALLVSDLLDISKIEAGKMDLTIEQVHLKEIVHGSLESYRDQMAAKHIRLAVEIDDPLPDVLGDKSRLKQIIDNLIINAIKFTPDSGQIAVTIDDLGDFLLTSVSDTGCGIKKENHQKIFEKFFQVDSSLTRHVGGTGLGLAITKTLVEMHGGRIWVESDFGHGATFRFLLPRLRNKDSFDPTLAAVETNSSALRKKPAA